MVPLINNNYFLEEVRKAVHYLHVKLYVEAKDKRHIRDIFRQVAMQSFSAQYAKNTIFRMERAQKFGLSHVVMKNCCA